ncbi:MAG: RNA polymerase sigma factor [Myxococcota bacterium]
MQIDDAHCEALLLRASAGDAKASRELIEYLWPRWLEAVKKSRSLGALARSEDVVHDVVARLVEKLTREDGRALKSYSSWHERHADKTFSDWIRIVTKNAVRDYARERLGPRDASNEPSVKRLLNEFANSAVLEELGVRPPVTAAQTARELLEFASKRLGQEQAEVLDAWLSGADFEDIGRDLGISSEQARQRLRAGIAILRRYFVGSSKSSG